MVSVAFLNRSFLMPKEEINTFLRNNRATAQFFPWGGIGFTRNGDWFAILY